MDNSFLIAVILVILGALHFIPPLPSMKLNLLKSIPLAYIVKFIFSYEEAFWRGEAPHTENGQYGFQTVLQAPDIGPAGIVYDSTSARGNPALIGFLTASLIGPGVEMNDEDLREAILKMLEEVLGSTVWNYIDCALKDWKKEPYNGGCFLKSIIPGTTKYFSLGLRESFNKVHFAGTESATVWCGFMNGAIQAGVRAATEVLYHLRPSLVLSPEPEDCQIGDALSLSGPSTGSLILTALIGLSAVTIFVLVSKRARICLIPENFTLNLLPVGIR